MLLLLQPDRASRAGFFRACVGSGLAESGSRAQASGDGVLFGVRQGTDKEWCMHSANSTSSHVIQFRTDTRTR